MHPRLFSEAQISIADIARWLARKGWAPATSSNYSIKLSDDEIAITRSGVDKSLMNPEDIIAVDGKGKMITNNPKFKASAETLIHTTLYKIYPDAGCVLHTHSVFGTRLSLKYQDQHKIQFEGYELLKGLEYHDTHEAIENLPILPNSQDMQTFSKQLEKVLLDKPKAHGFLIAGHGLYSWGPTISDCKRQIETLEFLLECKAYELMGV